LPADGDLPAAMRLFSSTKKSPRGVGVEGLPTIEP
jgi:hypothetical protein